MQNTTDIILEICKKAKQASRQLAILATDVKNQALEQMASTLITSKETILYANAKDIENAQSNYLSPAIIDRLKLDHTRIEAMAQGIIDIAKQQDPIGQELSHTKRPSGLDIKVIKVPLGVIAVIYESRPNVTVDAAALCLKSGNAVILRGGSECTHSNKAIINCLHQALMKRGLPCDFIQFMPTQDRQAINHLIQQDQYIDVVIPRGGKKLIEHLAIHSKIPLFKHLDGICHSYVHKDANIDKMMRICVNAKMRRASICGATETILIDQSIINTHLAYLIQALQRENCEIRLDHSLHRLHPQCQLATEDDWSSEYLDSIIAIKSVGNIGKAIEHINHYGSGHTDAIITEDNKAAQQFLQNVDSAVVMHNTSTQFSDGAEFGMGAEIGISTGKLHARGPVGINQLTTFKYHVISKCATRS